LVWGEVTGRDYPNPERRKRLQIDVTVDRPNDRDSGFGLVEILVSMFLLGLLAVGFLPLLVDAMFVSVRNATVATATQFASGQLDQIGAVPQTCAGLDAYRGGGGATIVDARNTTYTATRDVGACPTSLPATVPVKITVTAMVQGKPISVTTLSTFMVRKAA
jgi:prepilin-type N-terminal cleavage/methylation domain-containing protein